MTCLICQFFCNCICNALGIVYPCVTLLFYSSSLNSMIFEKYNSQQVYFDAGTLYFLVLQCIHHFHSFMNSNVSKLIHSTLHYSLKCTKCFQVHCRFSTHTVEQIIHSDNLHFNLLYQRSGSL